MGAAIAKGSSISERVALRRGPFAWLLLLSLLGANGWLLTEVYPSDIPFPFAGCIHCALIACVAVPLGLRNAPGLLRKPQMRGGVAVIALAGLAIFILPTAVLQLTAGGISSYNSASLFCAIPLMIVLASNVLVEASARQFLVPSLIGLTGMLLLVPHETPDTTRRIVCLAAVAGCCILIAVASLRIHAALQGISIAAAVALVGVSGAFVLGIYGLAQGWPVISAHSIALEAVRCAIFDLPVMAITLWLAREISPVHLSTRFLLTPLITVLEGYAFVRGPMELSRIAALILLAAGSAMLLLRSERDESEELPALHLR